MGNYNYPNYAIRLNTLLENPLLFLFQMHHLTFPIYFKWL